MHYPKLFLCTARNASFVQRGGHQIKLSNDREEAFARDHEVMANPRLPATRRPRPSGPLSLALYILARAQTHKVASLSRRLTVIGKLHRAARRENPVKEF